jgi:hypothetical protein
MEYIKDLIKRNYFDFFSEETDFIYDEFKKKQEAVDYDSSKFRGFERFLEKCLMRLVRLKMKEFIKVNKLGGRYNRQLLTFEAIGKFLAEDEPAAANAAPAAMSAFVAEE